jgi:hypothetical protein
MRRQLFFILTALFIAVPAFAQTPTPITYNDAAPPLSFCLGQSTTCVMPDFGLQTVNYDLKAKAWSGGVQTLAVGYALLFASNQPYASGVALHASFNFDQKTPSYFAPTFAFVGFHWFEIGYTPVFLDGQIGQKLTLGVNLTAEAITALLTGQSLDARKMALVQKRAAAEATKSLEPPAPTK